MDEFNLQSIENTNTEINNENNNINETNINTQDQCIDQFECPNELQDQPQEDIIERTRKELIIQFYLNEFGNTKLANFKNVNYKSMTSNELDDLKKQFDIYMGTKSSVNNGVKATFALLIGYEKMAVLFGAKINGISEVLKNDVDFVDDVKHMILSNINSIYTLKPEFRVLQTVISTSLTLHKMKELNINIHNIENVESKVENNISNINNSKNFMGL